MYDIAVSVFDFIREKKIKAYLMQVQRISKRSNKEQEF